MVKFYKIFCRKLENVWCSKLISIILDKINNYLRRIKKTTKNIKILIAPPFTLLDNFSKNLKIKK